MNIQLALGNYDGFVRSPPVDLRQLLQYLRRQNDFFTSKKLFESTCSCMVLGNTYCQLGISTSVSQSESTASCASTDDKTTTDRQPDNHQPSQSSICTPQVVLNAPISHLAAPHVSLTGKFSSSGKNLC